MSVLRIFVVYNGISSANQILCNGISSGNQILYNGISSGNQILYNEMSSGNQILWKRGENAPTSFPQYAQYISNIRSQITYSFVKCGCFIYFFLNSENLVCRARDISKYFRQSLGLRDNESRLYTFDCKNVVLVLFAP